MSEASIKALEVEHIIHSIFRDSTKGESYIEEREAMLKALAKSLRCRHKTKIEEEIGSIYNA
jgi:hypothetical protein